MVQSTNGQSELMRLSEELAAGKLVKNLTLFPALQITLVHPDMTREFEQACQVLYSDPLLLLGKLFFFFHFFPLILLKMKKKEVTFLSLSFAL